MKIRKATINDREQLRLLEQRVVDAERPFNSSIKSGSPIYYDLDDLLVNDNAYLLVIEVENRIIATGYSQIRPSKHSLRHNTHAYLGFMYVCPKFRGKGLNKALTDKLICWSRNKGINAVYLDVYSDNRSAIRAYEKLGFEPSLLEMKLLL